MNYLVLSLRNSHGCLQDACASFEIIQIRSDHVYISTSHTRLTRWFNPPS